MSADSSAFRKGMAKVFLYPLLSIFLIPLIAWLFVSHALPEYDAQILQMIEHRIDREKDASDEDKAQSKALYRAMPASKVCGSNDPQMQRYRANVCEPYSTVWQFNAVKRVSLGALIGGAAVLLAVAALGALALLSRRSQYLSFLLGWRLLSAVSAIEAVIQGALAVWLSFWVTAFFFQHYYVKLILLIGIAAALAVFYAVVCIFKRPPLNTDVDGELLSVADAPALWAHVRDFASRLKTKAPDQIVAGIDTNFFVTEAPLTVGGQTLTGRSLFISLPLLRVLDRAEADAVLAHELAHLRGGDTASSAALGPLLVRYDHYSKMMAANGLTLFVYYLLRMYRFIFEFALRRDSRAREFLADRVAARLVSAQAIAQSLVKVAAYARYRAETENKLFEHDQRHADSLGIASQVASGLAPYAASAQFLDEMKSASVPHPFDSHPPLPERMANVGHRIDERDFGRIASGAPAQSWVSDIQTAEGIEQRLWAAYEQRFAAVHEQHLAYRYEPANDAELAIVVRHFPPIVFALKRGKRIEINHAGLVLPEKSDTLSWNSVANLKYEDGIGGDVLQIVHPEKGWLGAKSSKVKLPGIKPQRDRFKGVLGHYWQRHQVMRQMQAHKNAAASSETQ